MTHQAKPAFSCTNGPRDAKVVLVGEAFGENEELLGVPFVGWSGFELSKMICEAGLCTLPPLTDSEYSNMMLAEWWRRSGLLLTNVFAFRPRENKIETLCGKKAEVGAGYWRSPLGKGGYIRPEFFPELERLKEELQTWPRTCVVTLGATASWALMNQPKISSVRGVAAQASALCPGIKVVPTYHPAGIMRNWSWRAIAVADLTKVALRESKFPEVIRPERSVLINPNLFDVREWFKRPAFSYGVDIETSCGQVTMIGFARSPTDAIVIPLVDKAKPGYAYWSAEDELEVWKLLRSVLEGPVAKVGQNFLYDLQYIIRVLKIRPMACADDTMLLSHSLMPEMQKSLGFLGSIHTNESSWKIMRSSAQDELKRDE